MFVHLWWVCCVFWAVLGLCLDFWVLGVLVLVFGGSCWVSFFLLFLGVFVGCVVGGCWWLGLVFGVGVTDCDLFVLVLFIMCFLGLFVFSVVVLVVL